MNWSAISSGIFLLPLLSIAILPALSSGHAEEEVVTVFTGELSLAKGFANYSASYDSANYRSDTQGLVSLHGLIKGDKLLKGEYSIAVLPEACRPENRIIFA